MQCHGRLDNACCSCSTLQVADIGLDRTQGHRAQAEAKAAEDIIQALQFDCITHRGGSAMALDHGYTFKGYMRLFPRPLDGKYLPDRVGSRNAFALAVAGSPDRTDNGIDPVPVLLSILEALQDKDSGTFTHDKTVGTLRVGPCA